MIILYREILEAILFSRLNVIRENKTAGNIWQYFNFDFPFQKIQTRDKYVFFSHKHGRHDEYRHNDNKESTEPT